MDFLQIAKQTAYEAGQFVRRRRGEGFAVAAKGPFMDIVTEVDTESEKLIFDRLKAAAPDHAWLGEEESFANEQTLSDRLERARTEPYVWIVDPIDGTNNFVQGIPGYTVSIGLACYGELTVGVIYDPSRDEMFYAQKGEGAFMNEQPISVSDVTALSQSVVATAIPSRPEAREAALQELRNVSENCRKIRSLGSAAQQLAYVACGRLDAYWQHGLNIWDIAAGLLIIEEAGGRVGEIGGGGVALTTTDVITTNGHIYNELSEQLVPIPVERLQKVGNQ